jgi:hypothetical protein
MYAFFNNHLVCYCDDCQTFARHLDAQASALDAYGGTAIVQVSPCQVHLDAGADQLRCLRLTSRGVTRWFTGCCNTPVANTVSAGLPFNGIVAAFIDEPDTARGPVRYRIQGQHAVNSPPDMKIAKAFPRLMMLAIGLQILIARIAGRQKPSPFYGSDQKPVNKPDILNA